MRLRDIAGRDDEWADLIESATAGATGAASVASIASPVGAINRRPSLFGYIPVASSEKKKRKKRK